MTAKRCRGWSGAGRRYFLREANNYDIGPFVSWSHSPPKMVKRLVIKRDEGKQFKYIFYSD